MYYSNFNDYLEKNCWWKNKRKEKNILIIKKDNENKNNIQNDKKNFI